MSDDRALVLREGLGLASPGERLQRFARAIVLELAGRIRHGRIEIDDGSERFVVGSASPSLPITVSIRIHDRRFWTRVLFGGSVGAGESYVDGDWSSDDVVGLVRIFAHDPDFLSFFDRRLARLGSPIRRLLHALRRNTRTGSRRNVAAHYDLGNDFYGLFLDPTLSYSCAVFEDPEITLEQAQVAKLDLICRKLRLSAADHLLDIGCGWGALAMHAAERYGARVTGATISRAQFELARERVRAAGLERRVEIVLADYRELAGKFDKIASIEMIEAVGHEYYDLYFRTLERLLQAGGLALLQAITIADHRFDMAKSEVDFIKRHVFPGSTIPSVSALLSTMAQATRLRAVHLQDFTQDYALTLKAWRERFMKNADRARAQGHDPRFMRLWLYYLAVCEGSFRESYLGDVQLVLHKLPIRAA